ncbi:MAG: DUF4080 domain-containing protein [Verrucomicrobia bacterium]|nr:DUF4080 domain-containing protein [Verrucomicrobiota bacterium]
MKTTASDIVLATLNARYSHCAFGLRYLIANLGDLQPHARLLEFNISQRPLDIAETILAHQPKILGLGIYVWNLTQSTELLAILKRIRPDLTIVLGGPEVSFPSDQPPICRLADHVIAGEGDLAFAAFCRGDAIPKSTPNLAELVLPYDLYTDEDIAHRILYVEASRGCPFQCEFCLSSLDTSVRQFPLDTFFTAMQRLLDRGALRFKFVDRSFNLDLATATAILRFFLDRYRPGLFLHLEMIPDRFSEQLRTRLQQFPPGAVQLEIGLQTFNEEVAARIGRRQNNALAETNLRWLREHTGVHLHTDLILGLPGETIESIADGFDRLVALRPHIIQVGILKRLRGAPIARHDTAFGMIYNPQPPYEILQNNLIDFPTMQRLWRFARYWEIVANSGRFAEMLPSLWEHASPFHRFLAFSDWLFAETGQTHAIALSRLTGLLEHYRQQPVSVSAPIPR